MKIASATHQGLVRLKNEDAIQTSDEPPWVVLADGMGGLLAGEEASQVAVFNARQYLRENLGCDPQTALVYAHEQLKLHANDLNYSGKMGTTLIVWARFESCFQFSHIGDSRVYAFYPNPRGNLSNGRSSNLEQLSEDHTVAQRMVNEGYMKADEAAVSSKRHVLTQALGMPGMLRPQSVETPTNCRLLFCSDGLSDLVSHRRLEEILQIEDIENAVDDLIKAALDAGGRDNISVVLIDQD